MGLKKTGAWIGFAVCVAFGVIQNAWLQSRIRHWQLGQTVGDFMSIPNTSTIITLRNDHSIVIAQRKPLHGDFKRRGSLQNAPNRTLTASTGMEWAANHLQILFPRQTNNTIDAEDDLENNLLKSSVRYFMYPEHMLLPEERYYADNLVGTNVKPTRPFIRPKFRPDLRWEIQIINALWNHSLRTDSMEEADLFIIPVPMTTFMIGDAIQSGIAKHLGSRLTAAPPFQQGKPHVLVSMLFQMFNKHFSHVGGLRKFYNTVNNVTVARPDDLLASHYCYVHHVTPTKDFRGFDDIVASFAPVTEYQFSMGLGKEARLLPLVEPTWDKFQKSTFFIFYRTRSSPSYCNSTGYRHAPILNVSALPRSSIGYNIEKNRWRQEYADSKFCLVIRGDTPHSHALLNAVKVGCIPVVISDWYPFYAPTFPTTLDMRDFCIFIAEEEFLDNPEKTLQDLQYLPQDVIKSKLASLKWAQQVTMMEHPHSMFVPAFVREAMASFSRPASQLLTAKQ